MGLTSCLLSIAQLLQGKASQQRPCVKFMVRVHFVIVTSAQIDHYVFVTGEES